MSSTKDEPLGQSDIVQYDIQTIGQPIKFQVQKGSSRTEGISHPEGAKDEPSQGYQTVPLPPASHPSQKMGWNPLLLH